MSKPFTLLQLSDCHFMDEASERYRGFHPDAGLRALLPACRRLAPDGVVWTGDLSETGSIQSYQRLLDQVRDLAPQQAWLPGNHDHPENMAQVFAAAGWQCGPQLEWGAWRLLLLNSASDSDPCGQLDDERLAPLKAAQESTADQPMMLFIHHQPLPVGAAWIDRYGFADASPLWQAMAGLPIQLIGFGHVHQTFVGQQQGIRCYSAPSTVANAQADFDEFVADPTGPKGRWYRLWPDGRWLSGLLSVG